MLLSVILLSAALDLPRSGDAATTLAPSTPAAATSACPEGKPRWAVKSRTRALASAPRSEKPATLPAARSFATLHRLGLRPADPIGLRLPLSSRCTRRPRDPPPFLLG